VLLAYNVLWYFVHSANGLVIVFQINFIGLLVGLYGCMLYFQARMGNSDSKLFLQRFQRAIFTAGGCWVVDSLLCRWVQVLPINPQLHAWWHGLCGLACHYSLMFELLLAANQHKADLQPTQGLVLTVGKIA
jgi:hypothetical protein